MLLGFFNTRTHAAMYDVFLLQLSKVIQRLDIDTVHNLVSNELMDKEYSTLMYTCNQ